MAVTYYLSSMDGAPVLNGTVGSLVTVLDACLVNGFGAMSPLGWTKPWAGTNKAAYKGGAQSNGHYLQVIDDATVTTSASGRWAKWCGYEVMTSVDAGTGAFPTAAQVATGLQVMKSNASDATARPWALVGDSLSFYLFTFWSASYSTHASGYMFGKTGSLREGDGFDTLIIADNNLTLPSYPGLYNRFSELGAYNATQAGKYYARPHTQIGSSVNASTLQAAGSCSVMGANGFAYPYPVTNGLFISAPGMAESGLVRCMALPGLFYPQHNIPLIHLDEITDITALPGRTLKCFGLSNSANPAQCLIDITGPWTR